jgi:hypothetical protein
VPSVYFLERLELGLVLGVVLGVVLGLVHERQTPAPVLRTYQFHLVLTLLLASPSPLYLDL